MVVTVQATALKNSRQKQKQKEEEEKRHRKRIEYERKGLRPPNDGLNVQAAVMAGMLSRFAGSVRLLLRVTPEGGIRKATFLSFRHMTDAIVA